MYSMHSLLASTCSFLDQANTPPPSLRDILGAYNTKGDGDRDMLIALLNAKSAEDQRLASVAALQRTVLQLIDTYPPDVSAQTSTASSNSPSSRSTHLPLHTTRPRRAASPTPSPHRKPASSRQSRLRSATNSTTLPPRKRPRVSHSPAASTSSDLVHPSTIKPDSEESFSPPSSSQDKALSSSPHSRLSQRSAEYSPRTRSSMTIGSLLSSYSQRGSERGFHGNRENLSTQNNQPD